MQYLHYVFESTLAGYGASQLGFTGFYVSEIQNCMIMLDFDL